MLHANSSVRMLSRSLSLAPRERTHVRRDQHMSALLPLRRAATVPHNCLARLRVSAVMRVQSNYFSRPCASTMPADVLREAVVRS